MPAWKDTVQRHNILCTAFVYHQESDRMIQAVIADMTAYVHYIKEEIDHSAKFLSQQSPRPNSSREKPLHVFSA